MVQSVVVANIDKAYNNPVAELVQTACKFESHITVQTDGKFINAKSLMGMMAFGLREGMEIEVSVEGTDEKAATEAIQKFLSCT